MHPRPTRLVPAFFVASFFAAALALFLTGCGKAPDATSSTSVADDFKKFPLPEPPFVADCEPGARGGRLVIAMFGDPKTFNPITE
ncbi:MAG: hypothetical protein HY301_10910, partial [Verrucomicrobia bacterium]|nr:hypothetical protein [Verrucomicrobiota bacterium]